eukprot:scaffold741_cov336-Pavlova_lutheri.AAC.14
MFEPCSRENTGRIDKILKRLGIQKGDSIDAISIAHARRRALPDNRGASLRPSDPVRPLHRTRVTSSWEDTPSRRRIPGFREGETSPSVDVGRRGATVRTSDARTRGKANNKTDAWRLKRLRILPRAPSWAVQTAARCEKAMGSLVSLVFVVCLVRWDRITRRNQGLRPFVQLFETRLVLCAAGGIWIAIQLLWNNTLWVPGRSYFDGVPLDAFKTMCKVYLLVGTGFSMPLFLVICLVLFDTAIGTWNEDIFGGGSTNELESRGIWLQTYQYGSNYTCADKEPCIFCAYPLVHILALAGFVSIFLLLLVPGSVAVMGVMTGLTPGALTSQIIAVILVVLVCCIVVGSSWIVAVEPEREAWVAAQVSLRAFDGASASCHQSTSGAEGKD